jgi:hypothetical protein
MTIPIPPLPYGGTLTWKANPAPPPPPPQPVALGAWTPPGPKPWTGSTAAHYLATFGQPPAIVHYYQDMVNSPAFDAARCDEIVAGGAIPLVSYQPGDYKLGANQPAYSCASFARGDHDAQLITWFKAVAAWGKPLLVRPFWEMNGGDYPTTVGVNGNTAGAYIDCYRYWEGLQRQYASLIRNVWCPCVDAPQWHVPLFEDCYPGDTHVDIVGFDAYNQGAANPTGVWWSFDAAIRPFYTRLQKLAPSKEILICETGCTAVGGDRAAWLAAIPAALATMPAVKGLVFWNNVSGTLDCRLDQDAATLAAFKSLAANPLMRGRWA